MNLFILVFFANMGNIISKTICNTHTGQHYEHGYYNPVVIGDCIVQMLYNPSKYHLDINIEDHLRRNISLYVELSVISHFRSDTFLETRGITNLTITGCQVKEIDANAFEVYTELLYLDMHNNSISSLAGRTFEYLRNLEVLDLSHNNILGIKRLFNDLPSISRIDLSANAIESVEEAFPSGSLVALNLSHNKIRNVPGEVFEELRNLGKLDLSYNCLSNANIFENMTALEYLSLRNNNITGILPGGYAKLNRLAVLDLGGNRISSWGLDFFAGIANLTKLDVSSNDLRSINISTFGSLHALHSLNISCNNITAISRYAFQNTPRLKVLDVSHNHLNDFQAVYFMRFGTVNLEGNQFTCPALSSILTRLSTRAVVVAPGNDFNRTNILGIPCEEHAELPNATGAVDVKDALERYFQEDFKKTNFLQLLQDQANGRTDSDHFQDLMKTFLLYEKQNADDVQYFHSRNIRNLTLIAIFIILIFIAVVTAFFVFKYKWKLNRTQLQSTNELQAII